MWSCKRGCKSYIDKGAAEGGPSVPEAAPMMAVGSPNLRGGVGEEEVVCARDGRLEGL